MSTVLQNRVSNWRSVLPLGSESNATSHAAFVSQLVPSSAGSLAAKDAPATVSGCPVFPLAVNAGVADPWIAVQPFGTDTANQTFDIRVHGWNKLVTGASTFLWVPSYLVTVTCTLGALVATELTTGGLWCDTVSKKDGDAAIEVIAPATDKYAEFYLNMRGAQFVSFSFVTGSSAITMGALWRTVSH